MKEVFVIWEYEPRRGYDREEPCYPFYATDEAARRAMETLPPMRDGYREVRSVKVVS